MPSPHRISTPLVYDTSAFELSPDYPADSAPWTPRDLEQTIRERTRLEKAKRDILVNYYRIGHTLAFPLPVNRRYTKDDLPEGIKGMEAYPWLIWMCWDLEERWRIFHAAWRQLGDDEAGAILQREIAALAQWDHFFETHNEVGLVTAHLASVLALVLADESAWDRDHLMAAQTAADALIDRDVAPWFAKQWPQGEPLTPRRIHNIPVLALTRTAQLARVRQHAITETLDQQAIEVLHTWAAYRMGPEMHTEGTAYDGYFMDAMTGWLSGLPQRDALLAETATAFRSLADQWMQLTLPGRLDLHAPIADTEQRMPFWANALRRLAAWYDWPDVQALLVRIPQNRMPAAIVAESAAENLASQTTLPAPSSEFSEHPHALTLRSGWTSEDFLIVAGAARNSMHHIHHDSGHLIIGWRTRFWITDPGYQQYRGGEERDYSIGTTAHNGPVINGTAQSLSAAKILEPNGQRRAQLDLSECYEGLTENATVQREIQVADNTTPLILVRDRFSDLDADATITTHWLGGAHFAWAFVDGWARLSDGKHALWIRTLESQISPRQLIRHDGTRGPLSLVHNSTLNSGSGEQTWLFWGDDSGGWKPPALNKEADRISVALPDSADATYSFD